MFFKEYYHWIFEITIRKNYLSKTIGYNYRSWQSKRNSIITVVIRFNYKNKKTRSKFERENCYEKEKS